jgi:hypothetical protein
MLMPDTAPWCFHLYYFIRTSWQFTKYITIVVYLVN